jgi:hypothetical protein
MDSLDAWRDRMIGGLLSAQQPDGSFGGHPYQKWTGAHWRLVSLVELGIPAGHRDAIRAVEGVLDWIAAPSPARVISGRERRHASMEGNALFVCSRLGLADDVRVRSLVETLLRAQWPDGGWNCDRRPAATHSSFHESVTPIRGLAAYHAATGDGAALAAARRGAELLLTHRVFRRSSSDEVIHPEILNLHWPPYWHYDFFIGLRAIRESGLLHDSRTNDALTRLTALRRPDGTWRSTGRRHWRPPGWSPESGVEAVDWGGASPIVTAMAQELLRTAR